MQTPAVCTLVRIEPPSITRVKESESQDDICETAENMEDTCHHREQKP